VRPLVVIFNTAADRYKLEPSDWRPLYATGLTNWGPQHFKIVLQIMKCVSFSVHLRLKRSFFSLIFSCFPLIKWMYSSCCSVYLLVLDGFHAKPRDVHTMVTTPSWCVHSTPDYFCKAKHISFVFSRTSNSKITFLHYTHWRDTQSRQLAQCW